MKEHISADYLLDQYLYELKSWERLLSFQKEELVCYKNRLAEVVNGSTEAEMILVAENFQEGFLAQERIVHYLTDELKVQKQVLEKEMYRSEELYPEAAKGQARLRREIKEGEEAFASVKGKFELFLQNRFAHSF